MRCPHCGSVNDAGASFCSNENCGRYLGWNAAAKAKPAKDEPEEPKVSVDESRDGASSASVVYEKQKDDHHSATPSPSTDQSPRAAAPDNPTPVTTAVPRDVAAREAPAVARTAQQYTFTRARLDPIQVNASAETLIDHGSSPSAKSSDGRRGIYMNAEVIDLETEAGVEVTATIALRNTGAHVERFDLSVKGLPSEWVSVEPPFVNVDKGAEGSAVIRFQPPRSPQAVARRHPFELAAWSASDPTVRAFGHGTLAIAPFSDLRVRLDPFSTEGKRRARHRLLVSNQGNLPTTLALSADDDADKLDLAVVPLRLEVGPGADGEAVVSVAPRKLLWAGTPQSQAFKVAAETSSGSPVTADGAFTVLPVFARWMVRAGTLATAAVAAVALLFAIPAWENRARPVPLVTALTSEAAEASLKRSGFKDIDDSQRRFDSRPAGTVIEQSPLEGVKWKANRPVTLVVSDGLPDVELADLRGLSITDARQRLEQLGLKAEVAGTAADPKVPANSVLSQKPGPREKAKPGSIVELTTSTGLNQVIVPPVENDLEAQATAKLQAAKLSWKVVTKPVDNPAQQNRVVSQSVAAGNKVGEGTVINITVGVPPPAPKP